MAFINLSAALRLAQTAQARAQAAKRGQDGAATTPVSKPVKRDEFSTGKGKALRLQELGDKRPLAVLSTAASSKVTLNPFKPGDLDVGVKGQASVGANGSVKGVGLQANVSFDASLDTNVKHQNGFATFTVSAKAEVVASAQVTVKSFSVGGSASKGATGQFQVRMTDADFAKLKAGKIPLPDPLHPETLPDHASVQLDKGTFAGSSFDASFTQLGATLKVGDSLKDSKGTTLQLERNGNDVTVTGGPTEVFDSTTTASLSAGPLKISLSSSFSDKQFQLQTATFDVGTAGGKQAAAAFSASGQIPTASAPGVKNVALIEKDLDSGGGAQGIELGPFSLTTTSAGGHANNILVHNSDGTTDFSSDFNTTGVQANIGRKLDASGNIIPGSVTASLRFSNTDSTERMKLIGAFKDVSREELVKLAAQNGDIQITLNQDQLKQLQVRAGHLINTKAPQATFFDSQLKTITDQAEFNNGRTRPEDQAALAVAAFSGDPSRVADLLGTSLTDFFNPGFRLQGEVKIG